MAGQPPPRGEVVGVFTIKHSHPSGDKVSITAIGENGTATLRVMPAPYLAEGNKVVLSLSEYVEE